MPRLSSLGRVVLSFSSDEAVGALAAKAVGTFAAETVAALAPKPSPPLPAANAASREANSAIAVYSAARATSASVRVPVRDCWASRRR